MLKIQYLVETEVSAEEFVEAFVKWIESRNETVFGFTEEEEDNDEQHARSTGYQCH